MRRSRRQQIERRRPLVEFNMLGDAKTSRRRRAGCASLLGSVLLRIAFLIAVGVGSHGALSV